MEIGVPAIKVGSDDFTKIPLLKKYATTGLPIIVSCGMSTLVEVYEALDAIGSLDGYPTILLITTSEYPTPPENVNLRKLETLAKIFPSLPIGLSDHTIGTLASSTAVAFGACLFEKHFTLDRNLSGPDHWFAEDPSSLKEWVKSIRTAFVMMGSSTIKPTQAEYEMRVIARRSIVAIRDIKKSEVLNSKNIGLIVNALNIRIIS
jgi:N,N'-diacetyllegionaminate synthase